MKIGKIRSGVKYQMDEQFQNFLIFGIFSFPHRKNSENFSIFHVLKFRKIVDFPIKKNSKNFSIFYVLKFRKIVNFPIKKILKISILENDQIVKIVLFKK